MEITEVRVFPVEEEKLKAFVSVTFDDCFVVRDIKVIEGSRGLFVSMPSKRRRNGTFRDVAHPLHREMRKRLEDRIIAAYKEAASQEGGDPSPPIRELGVREPEESRTIEDAPSPDGSLE